MSLYVGCDGIKNKLSQRDIIQADKHLGHTARVLDTTQHPLCRHSQENTLEVPIWDSKSPYPHFPTWKMEANTFQPLFPTAQPREPWRVWRAIDEVTQTRNPGAWGTLVAYTAQEPAYLLSPRTSLFLVPRWSYDFPCCLLTRESSLLDFSYMVIRLITMPLWRWKPHISPTPSDRLQKSTELSI